jgi:hypothetical protein
VRLFPVITAIAADHLKRLATPTATRAARQWHVITLAHPVSYRSSTFAFDADYRGGSTISHPFNR